jgi:hypothetical protein
MPALHVVHDVVVAHLVIGGAAAVGTMKTFARLIAVWMIVIDFVASRVNIQRWGVSSTHWLLFRRIGHRGGVDRAENIEYAFVFACVSLFVVGRVGPVSSATFPYVCVLLIDKSVWSIDANPQPKQHLHTLMCSLKTSA